MNEKLNPGTLVRILVDEASWADVKAGDLGHIVGPYTLDDGRVVPYTYEVKMQDKRVWSLALGTDFEVVEEIVENRSSEDSNRIPIKIKRLHPDAVLPSYAHEDDAGMDLTVIDDGENVFPKDEPGNAYYYREYRTGLAMEIPKGYAGFIFPRSSQSKTGMFLANCVGVVDAGYRGEVKARFKLDAAGLHLQGATAMAAYKKGDRACQLIIMPVPKAQVIEVEELSDTERGTGGFGSTGR